MKVCKTNNQNNQYTIKKYPIFYQREEYEIRIEKPYTEFWIFKEYITIYKVTKRKNWFGKDKLIYEPVERYNMNFVTVEGNGEDYYIVLFKKAFNIYLKRLEYYRKKEEAKNKQLAALENWDGVIS